jgi:hypothetical protein
MGVRIPHTSDIDRLLNIPRILVNIIYLFSIVGGIVSLIEYFNILKILNLGKTFNIIAFVVILIGGYLLSFYLYRITAARFFATLSSFLYVRHELKTKISWKDASYVSFLFTPNTTGKWYTMYSVLRLPKDQRLDYILGFADKQYRELNLK